MVEQAIQIAFQPSPTYEDEKIKGQRLRKLKGLVLQKKLEGRYTLLGFHVGGQAL